MTKQGNLGIASVVILISFILLAMTAFSVLSNDTTNTDSEEEIQEMIDDTIDEITKYIQITDKIGKFYGPPNQQKIQKIAIMIKPIFSNEIDISEITIKNTYGLSSGFFCFSESSIKSC